MKALLFDGEVRLDKGHPVPERKRSSVLIRVSKPASVAPIWKSSEDTLTLKESWVMNS